MIAIIDYDAGNIASVLKAFEKIGAEVVLTRDPLVILEAEKIVLPGVGAFGDAMEKLKGYGLIGPIREAVAKNVPFLGICLGLQLIFESSEESPGVEGIGLLKGKILRIPDTEGLKIPHIGWNDLSVREGSRLFEGVGEHPYVYFVHSYYLKAENAGDVAATTEYGTLIHAAVESGNIFATQFHPEKSGDVGLRILENFAALKAL